MIFTLENIINSLAGVLTARYPDYPVYASPNQQGTDYPCFFIFFMPSKIISIHTALAGCDCAGQDVIFGRI